VTVANLRAWNNLRSNTIRPGQTLKVSGNTRSRAATTNRTQTYRVRSGDSLTAIARKYGVTVTQIKQWNNLRSSTIRPGQQLKIKA
jgi:LysM repeat protein